MWHESFMRNLINESGTRQFKFEDLIRFKIYDRYKTVEEEIYYHKIWHPGFCMEKKEVLTSTKYELHFKNGILNITQHL